MTSLIRAWIAVGVLAFVGNAAVRPAIAVAAPANDEEPTVTPYGMPARPAPPPPTSRGAPAPAAAPTATPPAGNRAATPAQAPAPAQPYQPPLYGYPPGYAPAPGYPPPGYPPPGYAPPGYPQYPGYPPGQLTKVHRPRRGLVTGGAITFGVSWGIAASFSFLFSSCTGCNDNADYLWVPIAGPLIVAANNSGTDSPGVFILWSAAEAAGVIMFIVGMAGHDVMEYRIARGGPTLQLSPLLARGTQGLGLTARW
jgi:hypothetical protein